jgi:uncharacterized SAM-binding protein YcdF (DUF218 family)
VGGYPLNIIALLLLPPFNIILLGTAGILLLKWWPKMGWFFLAVSLTLLYVLSTPFFAERMLQKLEVPPVSVPLDNPIQAIVVLGSSSYLNAPEYGGDTVTRLGLERIRYAAWLYRLTGKPILASGGSPMAGRSSEAVQMKVALEKEFGVPVRWTERASANTRENAYKSFAVLKKEGVRSIALVTHAWHMPRAMREFERAGFEVTPAGTSYTTRHKTDLLAFIPSAAALQKSSWFFHEVIGMVWYWLTAARE